MAVLSKQEFTEKWGRKFADNTIQNITEAVLRDFRQDIADSFADVAAITAPTAPDYDAGAIYPKGAVVLFGLPNKLFYQAKLPGLLPAPTPGVETAEWLPVARPLSPLLPYREMPVQQGRDFASDGLLEPSVLYRFTGRVDANGDPLDDMLVQAMSRHSVAGADAYAIGIDSQTRQEYLLAVSYELATDTTSARTGGSAVDTYTVAEADALLAGKLNRQEFADLIGVAPAALDSIHELAAELLANEVGAAALLLTQQQQGQQIKDLQAAGGLDLSSYYTKPQADARYAPARSPILVLPFAANVNLDFSRSQQRLSLTNNIGFGPAFNKAEGAELALHLYNGAASDVTLSFPSAWTFLGPRPNVLATGSKAVLTLACAWGSGEGDITAGYAAEL